MEPHEYLATLRKQWFLIIALGLIGGLLGYLYASTLPAMYKSTSSVFVSSQQGETTGEILQGSNFTQAQVQSYAALAPLPVVLDPVIDKLDLDTTVDELSQAVTANIRLNTVIIDVTVVDRSADLAATIANAVTAELAIQAERLEARPGADGAGPTSPVTMTTVASARVDPQPFSPNTRFITLTGLLAGLALAVAGALALEILDTRIRAQKDIERAGPHAYLGVVANRKRSSGQDILMLSDPHGSGAEDFRRIGANLDFANIDDPVRSIVVTSASPAEGKSSTSVNLALAMAERFDRVLLIDADLRKPSVAEYCQIEGAVGLTSVLVGSATLDQAIRSWADGAIDVLPSGVIPANPSQMLGTEVMADLIDNLTSQYDFIVIDSPPLLPVTDSLTLTKLTDGAVVVARYKSTRRQQLAQAVESLEAVSAGVIGVVLNAVPRRSKDAYYGYVAQDEEKPDEAGIDTTSLAEIGADKSRADEGEPRFDGGPSATEAGHDDSLGADGDEGADGDAVTDDDADDDHGTREGRMVETPRRPAARTYFSAVRKGGTVRGTPSRKSG